MDYEIVDIDHVAIRVSDLEESLGFYHETLGLPVRDREKYDAGELPFVSVVTGGRHIHLFPSDESIHVGSEHICLLVRCNETDTRQVIEGVKEELASRDVMVEQDEPVERLGAYGRDWALYVRDPDNRIVELKFH